MSGKSKFTTWSTRPGMSSPLRQAAAGASRQAGVGPRPERGWLVEMGDASDASPSEPVLSSEHLSRQRPAGRLPVDRRAACGWASRPGKGDGTQSVTRRRQPGLTVPPGLCTPAAAGGCPRGLQTAGWRTCDPQRAHHHGSKPSASRALSGSDQLRSKKQRQPDEACQQLHYFW